MIWFSAAATLTCFVIDAIDLRKHKVLLLLYRFLTDAISDVSEKSGLSQAFLGLIILPIAGNACEHITAVLVAYKDKMDLAIGVALGSSIQIAIFVLPVLVLIGYVPFTQSFVLITGVMLGSSIQIATFAMFVLVFFGSVASADLDARSYQLRIGRCA